MNIILRPWQETDIASLVRNANNINIWNNLRDYFPSPYTEREAKEWIDINAGASPVTNFAIDLEGEAIGGTGLLLNSDVYILSAEIGYWLGEAYWGRGIATEAVRLIVQHCFDQFNLVRLYAAVFAGNNASMRVLEKNGFYKEAVRKNAVVKNAVLMDDCIWVKLRA